MMVEWLAPMMGSLRGCSGCPRCLVLVVRIGPWLFLRREYTGRGKMAHAENLVAFHCDDKALAESWSDAGRNDDVGNIPSPFRCVLLGPPGSGKTLVIKNLVVHQDPQFDEIIVMHADAAVTKEYNDLEPTAMFDEIPPLEFWSSLPATKTVGGVEVPIKRLAVVDDIEFTAANKQRLKNLAILFRYASSHKGLSVCLCHQSAFDTPAIARKLADVHILWKPRAKNECALLENRVGLGKGVLQELFRTLCPDPRDSIMVDHTRGTPCPLRLNIFRKIELEEE